jgi:hypothetical protein
MAGTQKKKARAARKGARHLSAVPHTTTLVHETSLSKGTQRMLIAGAAFVAAGAAATGAVVMRRGIGRLATGAASEALSAGHSVGRLGRKIGTSVGKEISEIDLARLLTYAGLRRRPSLLRRLAAPMGVFAALVAAGGSALFLVAPKLRAGADARAKEPKMSPSIARQDAREDSSPVNSIGGTIGSAIDEIEKGVSHAAR